MSVHYEVWVKPDNGPLTVQERDEQNFWCWEDKAEAIALARKKHGLYPLIDFIVREAKGHHGPYAKVYDTSVKEA